MNLTFDSLVEAADLAGLGVVIASPNATPPRVLYTSTRAAELLGCMREETSIEGWLSLPAEERERFHAALLGAGGSTGKIEALTVGPQGSLPIEVTFSRTVVSGQEACVCFVHDVTTRKQAEQSLVRSEARFRSVVESAPDGVVILVRGRIAYANARAALLLGLENPVQALGIALAELLPPEEAARANARIQEMFKTGSRHAQPAEYRQPQPDGSDRIIEISSIQIEYGGVPAVLAFARDVSERKAMLQRLILADRLAAIGTLVAGVTHEINNPLSYLSLNLQYLARELGRLPVDDSAAQQLVSSVQEALHGAEIISAVVRGLKTFARPHDERERPVDVTEVLESAIRIADNEIRHRARLVREYEASLPAVHANPARLEQVFLNLLVNASQALQNGDASSDAITVRARHDAQNRAVIVEVSDTGPGLDPNVVTKVFDPFFTTKPVGVGTGLGLTICQGIIQSLGGTIQVSTTSPEGTTFRVSLPSCAEGVEADPSSPAERPSASAGARGRILIIDDEELVATTLARVLKREHDVTVSTSADAALEQMQSQDFDAVLCDLMMPGVSGMDLFHSLIGRDADLARRVIFMTGGAFVPKVRSFLEGVPNPCFDKPLDLPRLRQALRRCVVGRTSYGTEEGVR